MDFNRIVVFVNVVRAGSFTRAAEELDLPKSSVSRSVAQLEAELGVRLLHRTTRHLALTDVGQAYYDSVSASVTTIEEADAAAREHGTEPRGTVRLTAPPDFEGLGATLAGFKRKYPGIRIELIMASRYVDLVSEGVDMALRAGRLEDSSLIARRIGTTELSLVAAPSYLRAHGRPRRLEDLAEHDFVLYRASGGRATLQLTGPEGTVGVEVTGSLVADDMSFCRHAVEAGAGIGLLPVQGLAPSFAAKKLELVLPSWSNRTASVYVVLPTARHVPSRVALLRDYLVVHVGKQLAETERRCTTARREPEDVVQSVVEAAPISLARARSRPRA
jgi:DNA-binding transcriptional LysR family regulator